MKKILSFLIIILILLSTVSEVFASDVLTAAQVGGLFFSVASAQGVDFIPGSASAEGMQNWITSRIDEFCADRSSSLLQEFGEEQARIVAGKLVVGQTLFNGIVNLFDWLVDHYNLQLDPLELSRGTIGGKEIDGVYTGDTTAPAGSGCRFSGSRTIKVNPGSVSKSGFTDCVFYLNGHSIGSAQAGSDRIMTGNWHIILWSEGVYRIECEVWRAYNTAPSYFYGVNFAASPANSLSWQQTENYVAPTVIDPSQEWQGTYGGQDIPDTNIDDLIGSIYEDVADHNLDMEGEVVSPYIPPTPLPTVEPGDIDGYWNRQADQLQGLGQDIGGLSEGIDSLHDSVTEQTESVTGAIDQAAADAAGTVAGSIDQAAEGIEEGVAGLTESVEEALDVPQASEIGTYKWDLSQLFPFCIPFDIAAMYQAFDGVAAAPHLQIPIVIPSFGFSYTMDLDFSPFDSVAAILRQVELIAFGLALAWGTSKVIRW